MTALCLSLLTYLCEVHHRCPSRDVELLLSADLTKRPVDGFSAGLVDDSSLFEWAVTIMGPPDTL